MLLVQDSNARKILMNNKGYRIECNHTDIASVPTDCNLSMCNINFLLCVQFATDVSQIW